MSINANHQTDTLTASGASGTLAGFKSFSSAEAGLAPASGGGTNNYLRADGTWATPPSTQAEALIYFDSSEFIPVSNNPPGVAVQQTTTHTVNRDFLVFDAGTAERAIRWFSWPSGWNTAKATIFWYSTASTGSVVWQVDMRVYTDGDAMDSAWGTAQSVTDAVGSANTHRQTSATPAITPAGTVTAGKHFALRLSRDAANASDTLAADALVMGVLLEKAS